MNGINNKSSIDSTTPSTSNQPPSETLTVVSMGRDISVHNESEPLSLNISPSEGATQSIAPEKESQLVKETLDETISVFSRCVSLHNEVKEDSRFLSHAASETLTADTQCMPEKPPVEAKAATLSPLELSINELKNENVCHTTVSVLEKHLSKERYSVTHTFMFDEQQLYKEYINGNPENNYAFSHKISHIDNDVKVYSHEFVILRKDNRFHILQSMVDAFSLDQWLNGDSSTIAKNKKSLKKTNDLILFYQENNLPSLFSKEREDEIKEMTKELKKIEPSFNKTIKTRKNKSCSKAIFNQKILPTLFSTLSNSDDRPYFRIFSASRKYLGIDPKYEMFFEVYDFQI
ncbi:hypothetical protein [Endozoicomonas sp. 8E]|uniref:hypothetical protein n=1 Tax=Endozoicomonas sp. 8E TaxID=3035692 RepID=UPI002938DF59|nr:hypothetical protein [Endozoicomonas sp. 8E]WOG30316.1 hypothetical protein P6910_11925 [Endozoicomonas sp. 8E]